MSGFVHPDHAEQRFTAAGGYVLTQSARPDEPMRFAVTAGDGDMGVELDRDEAFDLGWWLLREALAGADWSLVRAALASTSFSEQRHRAEQLDAMGDGR